MTDIDVRVDSRHALKMLAQCEKQIGFAAQRAVTRLAYDAQKDVRADLPSHFHIRNEGTSRAIMVQAAARKSGLDAEAFVFVGKIGGRDFGDWLERQETGGTKTPSSGKSIAIPKDIRSDIMEILKRAKRPRQLLRDYDKKDQKKKRRRSASYRVPSKPFILKDKNGKLYIAVRTQAKRPYTDKLMIYFRFISKVETPARFEFRQTTLKTVRDKMDRIFADELDTAFAKARAMAGVVTVRR